MSSECHLHLSLQNRWLENNLSILSLAYHLINSPIDRLLSIMYVRAFLFPPLTHSRQIRVGSGLFIALYIYV